MSDDPAAPRRRPDEPTPDTETAPVDLAPDAFRELGHQLIDRLAEFLESVPQRAAAPNASPAEVRARLGNRSLPESGDAPAALLSRACDLLFDGVRINGHPRSWGYIVGSPAPIGALADLIVATVNPNMASWNGAPMAAEMELQVIRWIAELLGYPVECGGILVSGGNMANFVGLLVARTSQADWNVREEGLAAGRGLRVYVSAETHTWIEKAADLFGLGTDSIRWIETDGEQRMRIDLLRREIQRDRASGAKPFLVVGTAGTVSTGAVDPLLRLAEIAQQEDLWFHVDGAYGAPAVLDPQAPRDLRGLRLADSVAVDGHKWLFAPVEAGCVLVRDRKLMRNSFAYRPSYYSFYDHPEEQEPVNFHEYGPQNSRTFRALKLWLALGQAGSRGYQRMICANIALAGTLARLLDAEPDFEVATRSLSITTFRYVPEELGPYDPSQRDYLDQLNRAVMEAVQRGGKAYLSNALVEGTFYLRTCITNFRSTEADVRALPGIVREQGQELHRQLRRAASPGANPINPSSS